MKKTCAALMILEAIVVAACVGQEFVPPVDPEPAKPLPVDEYIAVIEARPVVPFTPVKEADKFHGVALQVHDRSQLADYKKAIAEIAGLGADSITLAFATYQRNSDTSHIWRQEKLVKQAELVELIKLARSHKLRVLIEPIVLLDEPVGTEWRGKIEPNDPLRWWSEYGDYIRFAAKAASEGGAEVLYVGSELNRMEVCAENWQRLIKSLREEFPKLKLTYQANWDRYWKVAFWKDLDYATVTSFYTLANPNDAPTVEDLVKAWDTFAEDDMIKHYKAKLLAWQKTIGKPVVFGEIAYFSKEGTAQAPWNYCSDEPQKTSEEAQANCYKAFLKVWADEPMIGGLSFFEWTPGASGPKDTGYSPQGKQAEKVLRDYFKQRANLAATSQPG